MVVHRSCFSVLVAGCPKTAPFQERFHTLTSQSFFPRVGLLRFCFAGKDHCPCWRLVMSPACPRALNKPLQVLAAQHPVGRVPTPRLQMPRRPLARRLVRWQPRPVALGPRLS